jgi:hypothetical protein
MRQSLKSLVTRLARRILGALARRVPGIDTLHAQGQAQALHRAMQCRSKSSAATCRPWCTGMHLPGQRSAQASSSAVESAPPLKATASGSRGAKACMAASKLWVMGRMLAQHNGPAGPSAVAPNA